jgi:hypothetical protein
MNIDLCGMTVSSALTTALAALAKGPPASGVSFLLDDEVLKLNLMQRLKQNGFRCHSQAKGRQWLIEVKAARQTPSPLPATLPEPTPGAPPTRDTILKTETLAAQSFPAAPRAFTLWYVVQSDQIGSRDFTLGHQLLRQWLNHALQGRGALFFQHRGVRCLGIFPELTDHAHRIFACEESCRYYQVPWPHQWTLEEFFRQTQQCQVKTLC